MAQRLDVNSNQSLLELIINNEDTQDADLLNKLYGKFLVQKKEQITADKKSHNNMIQKLKKLINNGTSI